MSSPLIGVTTYRSQSEFGLPQFSINDAYIASLVGAGACPTMIPLGLPQTTLDALLDRLDGVLFSGGGDIHPQQYGGPMHPLAAGVDADRDRVELYLLQRALNDGLPFLGICRGLQVINVGLGGSLYEHLLDQRPGTAQHQYYPDWPRDHLAHPIQLARESRLSAILGETQPGVNSMHHQGVKCLAPDLHVTAWAPDGLVEAFELNNHPFGLAVQWHPEHLQAHAPMRALFRAFVEACGQRG